MEFSFQEVDGEKNEKNFADFVLDDNEIEFCVIVKPVKVFVFSFPLGYLTLFSLEILIRPDRINHEKNKHKDIRFEKSLYDSFPNDRELILNNSSQRFILHDLYILSRG